MLRPIALLTLLPLSYIVVITTASGLVSASVRNDVRPLPATGGRLTSERVAPPPQALAPCAGNTSLETALPLALGKSTPGVACYSNGSTPHYYWKVKGPFAPSDWLRLRVSFDGGSVANDVDFVPLVTTSTGEVLPIAAVGNCSSGPGVDEDCGGVLMQKTRVVYIEAHPLPGAVREPFHLRIERH